ILIGGAMAFTFLAAEGGDVGDSLVEPDQIEHCKGLLAGGKILIPTDIVAADDIREDANARHVSARSIPAGWKGVDIGPETAGTYADVISGASTVLWNGPMGIFEMAPFAAGTRTVAVSPSSAAVTAPPRCGRWASRSASTTCRPVAVPPSSSSSSATSLVC